MSDIEERIDALEAEVADLREDVDAVKQTANRALSRSIDVKTDFEDLDNPDDRLSEELSELQSTVRVLQNEIAEQSSSIESWAAQLIENMLVEMAQYGNKRLVYEAKEAHRSLQSEPDRTTIYDVFRKASELTETEAVRHVTDPHRIQIDLTKDEPPRVVGLHSIDVPDEFCGGSTTTESGVGGRTTPENDRPITTTIGTD